MVPPLLGVSPEVESVAAADAVWPILEPRSTRAHHYTIKIARLAQLAWRC